MNKYESGNGCRRCCRRRRRQQEFPATVLTNNCTIERKLFLAMCYSLLPSIFRFIFCCCCSDASRHRHSPLIQYSAYFAGFKYLGMWVWCAVECVSCAISFAQTIFPSIPSFAIVRHRLSFCQFIFHKKIVYTAFQLYFGIVVFSSTAHASHVPALPSEHTMYNALIAPFFSAFRLLPRRIRRLLLISVYRETHYSFSIVFTFIETHQRLLISRLWFFFLLPIWQNLKIITQTNWGGWRVILFFFLVTRSSVNKSLPKS